MSGPTINLWEMPYDVMLIVERPSGVTYWNQVCGVICMQAKVEGVLAPLGFADADVERVMNLPYEPIVGLRAELADQLDAILAASARTSFVKVDRARLKESMEAWVFVVAENPALGPGDHIEDGYFGSIFGFGQATGVLTWHNSD